MILTDISPRICLNSPSWRRKWWVCVCVCVCVCTRARARLRVCVPPLLLLMVHSGLRLLAECWTMHCRVLFCHVHHWHVTRDVNDCDLHCRQSFIDSSSSVDDTFSDFCWQRLLLSLVSTCSCFFCCPMKTYKFSKPSLLIWHTCLRNPSCLFNIIFINFLLGPMSKTLWFDVCKVQHILSIFCKNQTSDASRCWPIVLRLSAFHIHATLPVQNSMLPLFDCRPQCSTVLAMLILSCALASVWWSATFGCYELQTCFCVTWL